MTTLPPQLRLNLSAGLASVATATVLVLLKLWAFLETGSLSIAASLADSSIDFLVSLAGLAAIAYAARPADEDHAFGHEAIEDITSFGQAIFILGSGCAILWIAAHRLVLPEPPHLAAEGLGIAVMCVSAVITLALVTWQGRVSRSTGNKVVAADMLHYIGDLVPTIGAVVALICSGLFGWGRIDSVFAIGAALFMIWGALKIGREGWHALMSRSAPEATLARIARITRSCKGVRDFHDLKTRTSGAKLFVQLHIELDGDQPLSQAHRVAAALKQHIIRAYPQADVIIHMDVWKP